MNNSNKDTTDRIGYYFRNEKGILFIVVITGILYNAGIVAGPWFEGQMVQYLCDIIGSKRQPIEMVLSVTGTDYRQLR